MRDALAPRNDDRGLLVLTLGSGVCGLLPLLLPRACAAAAAVVELFVLVDAARSRDSSSS